MEPERLGVGPPRHRAERALGAFAIPHKLRRLRAQEERQRLPRREPLHLRGEALRRRDIAGPDRDQALRNRLISAHAAAVAKQPRQHHG